MQNSDPKRGATPLNASTPARPPTPAASIGKPQSGRPDSGAPGRSSGPPGKAWLLRKRGSTDVLRCPDLMTLRTWMIERRVSRDDEISRGGKVFRRIGNIVEFESLFHSAEVERAERRRGQKATNSGMMAVPQLSSASSARSEGSGRRSEVSVPPQLRVTPPGLTPAAGNMNPLRMTPSGQPNRPRPPVPAVPILQIPDTPTPTPSPIPPAPVAPAATAAPPSTRPAAAPAPERAPSGGPSKAAASASAARPAAASGQASSAAKKPAAAPATPAPVPPAPPARPRVEAPEPAGEESGTDPTRRFVRLDAAAIPAERSRADAPSHAPASDGPKGSGNDTVAFRRADPADLADDSSDSASDADATLINPQTGATPRPPAVPAKPVDPVEEALRMSDPVPRHMKETTDPNRTSRMPSIDTTERIEGGENRRGMVLLLISLGLAGLLILGLRSAGTPDPGTGGNRGGGTTTNSEPDHGTAGSPPNTIEAPTPGKPEGPATGPVANPGAGTGQVGTGVPAVTPQATPAGAGSDTASKPATSPDKPADSRIPGTGGGSTTTPAKPAEPTAPTKPAGTDAAKTGGTPAATPGTTAAAGQPGATTTAPPAAGKPATAAATSPTAPPKAATTAGGKKIVITEFPKTFDEQMDLAQRLVEHEQFEEAQRLFETILSYASHVPAVHVGLGKCALETGRLDAAVEHYNNALGKATNYGPAIFGLAKTYRAKGDKERAIQQYRRYLELYPNGGAAGVARDSIARLEGNPPPPPAPKPTPSSSELVRPPTQGGGGSSELVKPQ